MIRSSFLLAGIGLIVAFLYVIGVGEVVDDQFADFVLKHRGTRNTDAPVVLLRIDKATVEKLGKLPWDETTSNKVLDSIEKTAPKKVIIASSPNLIFQNPDKINRSWLNKPGWVMANTYENKAKTKHIQLTVPDKDGMVRHLYPVHPNRKIHGIAWEIPLSGKQLSTEPIRINFAGTPSGISNLSVRDIVTNAAPKGFLKDKFIVIGLDIPDLTRYVMVPVSSNIAPMSEAEFHTNALISLLDNSVLVELEPWQIALIVFIVLILHWLIMLPTTLRFNLIATAFFIIGAIFVSILVFAYLNVIFPIGGMLFALILAFFASSERKANLIQRHTQKISNASRWELTLHPIASDRRELSEEMVWDKLVKFSSLHLHPDSMMLARPISGGGRIKYKRFFSTDNKQIGEKRRDLTRNPYAKVIAQSTVMKVDGYMADKTKTSYLVPLFYPSQFLGLWVVNYDSKKAPEAEEMTFLMIIGRQVARLLHFTMLRDQEQNGSKLVSTATDKIERQLVEVDHIFANLVEEKEILRSVLSNLTEGVAITDIFGRVLSFNEPILEAIEKQGLEREKMNTLSDLLVGFGAVKDGDESDLLFNIQQMNSEYRFHTSDYRFVVRILQHETSSGEQIPEGFLLLTNLMDEKEDSKN